MRQSTVGSKKKTKLLREECYNVGHNLSSFCGNSDHVVAIITLKSLLAVQNFTIARKCGNILLAHYAKRMFPHFRVIVLLLSIISFYAGENQAVYICSVYRIGSAFLVIHLLFCS